jgi:hypothetical protein
MVQDTKPAVKSPKVQVDHDQVVNLDLLLQGAYWAGLDGRYVYEGRHDTRPYYKCGHLYLCFLCFVKSAALQPAHWVGAARFSIRQPVGAVGWVGKEKQLLLVSEGIR